jgi:hypothetical protein
MINAVACITTKILFGLLILMVGGILAIIFAPVALWLKRREERQ